MNTAHSCTGPTSYIGVKDEYYSPEYWEAVLAKEGLSMDRAGSGSRLSYGHRNSDTVKVHDYQPIGHNAPQKNRGKKHAEQIVALMNSGLSAYAAIKTLGMSESNAYRALRRYRKNFPTGPTSYISEDSNVD